MILYLLFVFKLWDLHFGSYWSYNGWEWPQGHNHGIDIGGGGGGMWAFPQIFFLYPPDWSFSNIGGGGADWSFSNIGGGRDKVYGGYAHENE